MVYPNPAKNWKNIDRKPNLEAREQAQKLFENFKNYGKGANTPIKFKYNNKALELFTAWHVNLMNELRSGNLEPALESHFSKYRKLVPALNLIFELCNDINAQEVTFTSLQKAISLSDVLRTHAYRIYDDVDKDNIQKAKLILNKIKEGKLEEIFTARDIYRHCWSGLNREGTEKGLNILVDYDWLLTETYASNYKPMKYYKLNPKAKNF